MALDIPSGWLTKGEFDNVEKIKEIETPFLLIHGEEDDFVRYRDNGKVVFENARLPKSLKLIRNANHTDIPEIMGMGLYLEMVWNWIIFSIDNGT